MIYRFLCIKIVYRILLFSFILLIFSSVSGQILIDDTSFGIGKGINITVVSDMEVSESVIWLNDGVVNIVPLCFSNIIFNAKEGKESLGKFVFTGDGNILLSSDNSYIQMQNMQIERDIDIDNNIQLGKTLSLLNGIVFLNNYSVLTILNPDEESLLHEKEESYIDGKLKRRVEKNGGVYNFPVGSSYGHHNVKIKNISSPGYVCIDYDETAVIADNLLNSNTEIAINGFWHISTSQDTYEKKISFTADFDMSVFNNRSRETVINELVSKKYNDALSMWGIVPTNYSYSHLSTLISVSQADYCIIKRKESEFVNTLIVNGISESRFILPVISGINNGELTIVNNHGKVVFHSNNYNNDFDGASVQQGTYYYSFYFLDELSGKRKEKKGFIEVLYEK